MSSESDTELESFRRQWQEEVLRRRTAQPKRPERARPEHQRTNSKDASLLSHHDGPSTSQAHVYEDEGNYGTYDFDDMEAHEDSKKVGESGKGVRPESIPNHDPISALDHYEMAVVRETEGKLGESLDLYRKAFRLDDCIDQLYKRKHFPATPFKTKPTGVGAVVPVSKPMADPQATSTVSSLVASFADVSILGALPMISGDVSPPCPIKDLPNELLVDLLHLVAQIDIAALGPLAQTSKRLAYLVATQDSIWKGLVHGSRYGFGGMHYSYAKEISGASLEYSLASLCLSQSIRAPRVLPITLSLNAAYPTYRHMFQHRPRIRFSGVYISTVNYTRPGANGANTLTWNTPIHVVTYYRYLRFYRDGTCISLLTTTEPLDVVPYLQKANIGGDFIATTTLPVGVMRDARRGRWKLSPPKELLAHDSMQIQATPPPTDDLPVMDSATLHKVPTTTEELSSSVETQLPIEPEGILMIETEGPNKTYQYTARFEIQSSGKNSSTRNTKLVWRGFWSHNVISGDWGEFGLKNDRAFVWSRVRSWANA